MPIFDHVLLPVATEEDAETTCTALEPYLGRVERVTAVHVIEKREGAVDKAPVEKRRSDAAEYLSVVEAGLADTVAVDTRTAFGADVVEAVLEEAAAVGATAIAFRSRGSGRITRLLSGDVATRLVTESTLPVVVLPNPPEAER